NETDNYQQHHNHLIWEQKYGNGWKSNTTLYYTRGKGYYENFEQDANLEEYEVESDMETSDLVRQKWLNNHFYGVNFNLENQKLGNLKFFTGISANRFENQHYGIVNWVEAFENQNTDIEFYRNKSDKNDFSVYTKALYELNKFELFADLQYRFVNYTTKLAPNGDNPNEAFFPFEENYNFFNPKFGFNFHVNRQNTIYFYYGMAHREPIRSDFMDNGKILKPEKMQDFELGYKKSGRWNFNANLYYMYYLDQLVATGQLNDVGGFMRTNSGKSYRTGIEIQTQFDVIPSKLKFFGNATYSINKNLDYNEIGYDENGNEVLEKFGDTDISFSPDLIASFGINYVPAKNLNLNLSNKYVSEQYLTNTELADG